MTTRSDLDFENRTISVSPDDPDVRRMPRLCRFYGLSFQELWALPRWLLIEFDAQVERLTAQEQLLAMQVADFPHIPQKDRQKIHRDMVKAAGLYAETPEAPVIKPRDDGDIRKLAGMGIGVKFEGKPAAAAEAVTLDA